MVRIANRRLTGTLNPRPCRGALNIPAIVRAQQSDDQAMIAHLKLQIEKLNRDRYGPRSERTARLPDQLEMQLEELEASATEDELAA